MPHELEYVVKDALMLCNKGSAPAPFTPTHNTHIKINSCLVSTAADKIPMTNVPTFGACSAKAGNPCTPTPIEWRDTYKVKVKRRETILFKSKLPCAAAGTIEFITSGQVKLPPEEYDKLMEEYGEDNSGWGFWDYVELVPVVGSVVGIVRESAKGNWGMAALNVGFLVMDIAGLVSFGASTAASTVAKTGIKAGIKATAKSAAKTVAKLGTKSGAKQLAKGAGKAFAKAASKRVDDIAKLNKKICVFACFPAGTKIATKTGHKNIEEIAVGDQVWAYNEKTGESDLKPVINTIQRDIDATIKITLGDQVIETTAEHPFYTQKGWVAAADLTTDDQLKTKNNNWQRVEATNFLYSKKKVYNFEVEDWHTYFVGLKNWLVHNAKVCLHELAQQGIKYAQDILRGIKFNKIMQKRMTNGVHELWTKGMKTRLDTLIPGKAIISRKATQLSDVTFDTAKKYIDEIAKKYPRKKGIQNTKRAGVDELNGKYTLQIPKQNKPIPQNVKDYARKKKVIIDEVKDVTMDMLKSW